MKKTKNSYKKSGVNIESADKFTKYIGKYSQQVFKKKINKIKKKNNCKICECLRAWEF